MKSILSQISLPEGQITQIVGPTAKRSKTIPEYAAWFVYVTINNDRIEIEFNDSETAAQFVSEAMRSEF